MLFCMYRNNHKKNNITFIFLDDVFFFWFLFLFYFIFYLKNLTKLIFFSFFSNFRNQFLQQQICRTQISRILMLVSKSNMLINLLFLILSNVHQSRIRDECFEGLIVEKEVRVVQILFWIHFFFMNLFLYIFMTINVRFVGWQGAFFEPCKVSIYIFFLLCIFDVCIIA